MEVVTLKDLVIKVMELHGTAHFDLDEFLKSDLALKNKIENLPSFEIVGHLYEVMLVIEPIRANEWKGPIYVSSGFRCDKLNQLLGGVKNSVHKIGYAVDLVPKRGTVEELAECFNKYFERTGLGFDQIIIEKDKKGNKWLHFGLYNNKGEQRRQFFTLNKK